MMRTANTGMRLALALMLGLWAWGHGMARAGGDLFSPAATVNGTVITRYELAQRQAFLTALRQPGDLAARALDDLITDRLELDAAQALNVTVGADEVKAGMAEFASRANLSVDDFLKAIATDGVEPETFRDFVKAGIVWRAVLRAKFAGRIRVTDAEIAHAIADGAASGGTLRVLLSELVLVDDGKSDAVGLARRIRASLTSPADFAQAARQFSKAGTAAGGGALGWVDTTALPPPVAAAVAGLKPGEISQPVAEQGSVALFLLRDQSQGKGAARGADMVDYAVFLPGAGVDLNRLQGKATDCAALDVAARGLPEPALQRQTMAEAAVPATLRPVLAGLDAGESTVVQGVGGLPELVMLCSRIPQSAVPASTDDVKAALTNQKLGLLAQAFLQDLRAKANIVRQ